MGVDYTQEKLWQAMDTLVGTGSLQERLRFAGEYLLRLRGKEVAFPAYPALQERLMGVLDQLTAAGSF